MELKQARQLIKTAMSKDKRQAVPTIRALINEAEVHLQRYGSQAKDVKLRNPAELLQARSKITDAVELSETYELTVIGEKARQIERQTLDALSFWGEQRRQMIEAALASSEGTLPPQFNAWVEEYRLCFPDKEALITGWRKQKSVLEVPGKFEQDLQEIREKVVKLQNEAETLYNTDPVNNEGLAIGTMRRAYEEAKRLADIYLAEQAARELAVEARSLYERRKEAWSKSLVTSARFAQFARVRKQWEQAKAAGEEKVVPYEAILDEEGELVFGFEEGEEILTLVEGEPVSIDDALSRLSDIEFKYADTKTSQYIHIAEEQAEANPKGALDTLEEFETQYTDVLRETHKKRLEAKLKEYRDRLSLRRQAEDLLDRARTEASATEAWRLVSEAAAIDNRTPGLGDAKAEIGKQLQVVLQQEVLPEYERIGVLEHEGNASWDRRIEFLSDLYSLIAGYEPLRRIYTELGRIIKDLGDFRDLDAEISRKLPGIRAKLKDAPEAANTELEVIEAKLNKLQRAALYPVVEDTRQLINAYLNLHEQKRVWLAGIDDENKLLQSLSAIETAVREFAHLRDEELQKIHKRYQARAKLSALETDKEYGLLSDGLQAELEAIDSVKTLLQEADETDRQLIGRVNELSRWLNKKKRDYDKLAEQLPPLLEKIESRDFIAADSMFDILFDLFPGDPTLVQRKSQMEVEWKIHLLGKLTDKVASLDKVRNSLPASELRHILSDIDKLQELAGERIAHRFQELKTGCYLGLARVETRQRRHWLEEADRTAPEGSTVYGHVRAELDELQREDDFAELAQESDEQKRVLRLEKMRVRYPNDLEILELLADLYLKLEEPLKAQSIAEHMKLLQRRGRAPSLNVEILETQINESIRIHDWKRSVLERLGHDASLESLRTGNELVREAPLKPHVPGYLQLEEWYDAQKRTFADALVRQARDLRDRHADLVDICEKMIRVWFYMPQSQEAKDALEDLGTYSLDLQRQLEQEARDTTGRTTDAPDWLNQQIKRVDSLIERAKRVSRILEFYYERSADAEDRRQKSVSLREQIEALATHKRDLSRLRSELAALQSDWREVRESKNPNDSRWDSLERRVDALQTGSGEYTVFKRLRQHEQVRYFFNLVKQSRSDQRALRQLFEELQRSMEQERYQAALELINDIRDIHDWEKYRFEDNLRNIPRLSPPVTLAALEELLLNRLKLFEEVSQLVATHTRRLRRWKDGQELWAVPKRERLLDHSEIVEVLYKLRSSHRQEVKGAIATYRRMLEELYADHWGEVSSAGTNTVQGAVRQSLREGRWEEAVVLCWQAAFNEPEEEERLSIELERLKNEANTNNNPGPFVRRAKEIATTLASPGNDHFFAIGSWHYFLTVSARFPEVLPEDASNQRIALELAHMEMIRSDVEGWLEEAKDEIQEIASLFRQFTTHYITAQQSLDKLRSLKWQRFRRQEVERLETAGQLAYNECRRICPDYPYPQPLRDRFE